MFSNRIKLIASLLDKDDIVLDVGTDHALLPIYLIKNDLVKSVDGSDISSSVLDGAYQNLKKFDLERVVKLYKSDGLKDIDDITNYNTLVIAGMGFLTIKDILLSNSLDTINKLVIQTNNDYEETRRFINSLNYKIDKEICIKDKNINYIIFKIGKGSQKLTDVEYSCGIYNPENKWYYKEYSDKLKQILENIPDEHKEKRNNIINLINNYLDYYSK